MSGLSLNYFILEELGLPIQAHVHPLVEEVALQLAAPHVLFAATWLSRANSRRVSDQRSVWALTPSERLRRRCTLDAICLVQLDVDLEDATFMIAEDLSTGAINPNGFWRVDQDLEPELRQTVLTLVAFADLDAKIRAVGGDRQKGIEAFLNQNDGEGWMLPESVTLADYGLGRDDRSGHPRPVASRLGPRFYDWQLAQTAGESWRECEIHAKNLQGGGLLSSEVSLPADTGAVNKRSVPLRAKHRRQDEKSLFALDGQEDEPA